MLSAFPWMTDAVLHNGPLENLLCASDDMRHVGRKLDNLMHSLWVATDQESVELKDTLKTGAPPSRNIGVKVCSILAAFRAFDMAVQLSGTRTKGKVAIYSKKAMKVGIDSWDKMSDWHNLLHKCKSQIYSIKVLSLDDSGSLPSNALAVMLHCLSNAESATKGTQILKNFTYASLYLAMLMKVQDHGIILNVPDDVASFMGLAHKLAGDPDASTGSAVTDIANEDNPVQSYVSGVSSRRHMRVPFLLAAMASPLILLLPVALHNKAGSKADLIEASKNIGNDHGPVLTSIVTSLWEAMFKTAKGLVSPLQALRDFISGIDWEELKLDVAAGWYLEGPSDLRVTSSSELSLGTSSQDDADGSKDTNEGGVCPPSVSEGLSLSSTVPESGPVSHNPKKRKGKGTASFSQATTINSPALLHRYVTVAPRDGYETQRIKIPPPPEARLLQRLDVVSIPFDAALNSRGRDCVTLDIDDTVTSVNSKAPLTVYSAKGVPVEITLVGLSENDVSVLHAIFDGHSSRCREGLPPYMWDTENSFFAVMDRDVFGSTPIPDLHRFIRNKCIVIREDHISSPTFDEGSLSNVADLDVVLPVHDFSVPLSDERRGCDIRKGTLRQVLASSRMPSNKVLLLMDWPQNLGGRATPFSTDMRAWNASEGLPYCKHGRHMPVPEIRRSFVALKGLKTPWYINRDGFGRFFTCDTGRNLVVVARDREGVNANVQYSFDSVSRFVGSHFDQHGSCASMWDFEIIALEKGETMYIPPNTPHMLYTDEHSICFGGHFLCVGTMAETLVAFVHTRMVGSISTGTSNDVCRELLQRIVSFYHHALVCRDDEEPQCNTDEHLPRIVDVQSVVDVFSLCAMVILTNAFSNETYEYVGIEVPNSVNMVLRSVYDLNRMTAVERKRCSFMRGLAWEIVEWVSQRHRLTTTLGAIHDIYSELFVPFMGNLCVAIWNYKLTSNDANSVGCLKCDPEDLWDQMQSCFVQHPDVIEYMTNHRNDCDLHIIHSFNADLLVEKSGIMSFSPYSIKGNTSKDDLYDQGLACNWQLYENMDYEGDESSYQSNDSIDPVSRIKRVRLGE